MSLLVMAIALAAELVRFAASRIRTDAGTATRILVAFTRPWLLWSVVNVAYRAGGQIFNNPVTYPFFANEWRPDTPWPAAARELVVSSAFWFWTAAAWSLGAVTVLVARRTLFSPARTSVSAVLLLLFVLASIHPLTFSCLPYGADDPLQNKGSLLAPWFKTGGTMLYAMPRVKSAGEFMRDFEEIQPHLELSIHGASHPPGAVLSLYALGRLVGARERVADDRLRYAIALSLFSALGVLAMYLLGRDMFSDPRAGLLAAFLWAVKPAALAHNTFAQDGVYSVFFIMALWLAWRVSVAPAVSWPSLVGLGVTFYGLTMLTYSWCIVTTVFALFLFVQSRAELRKSRDLLIRFLVPCCIMGALLVATCAHFDINYFSIFFVASAFVDEWYLFSTFHQWAIALVGGQVEWLVMMGAVAASVFVGAVLPRWFKESRLPQARLGLILMACYAVPLLIGPNPLKMETARCWSWVTSVPLAAVAHHLLRDGATARVWVTAALVLSLLQYYVMRLAMCYLS